MLSYFWIPGNLLIRQFCKTYVARHAVSLLVNFKIPFKLLSIYELDFMETFHSYYNYGNAMKDNSDTMLFLDHSGNFYYQ